MALAANISIDIVARPRLQLQKDVGGTLTLKMYSDGTQSIPSSATISVFRPGGGPCTTPVSGATVTVDSSGTMTYALTAGNADLLPAYGEAYAPWTANWSAVVSGTTYKFLTVFDVVLWPVYNVVTQSDLINHHPDLTDILFSAASPAETTAQVPIDQAWEEIYRRLENAGNRPWLIIDSESLRRPTEHLALSKMFAARFKETSDRWHALYEFHQKAYDDWFTGARFVYDYNQTGSVSPDEVGRPVMQPTFRV